MLYNSNYFSNNSRVPFQPTGTNIVTNTAPTPGVRMRVVRSNGETANMVGLGEDLQLRIGNVKLLVQNFNTRWRMLTFSIVL